MLKEKTSVDPSKVEMIHREYDASDGKEIFVSLEEPEADALIAYLRLRMPSPKAHRTEVEESTAIIRELHVYGTEVPVGQRDEDAWQHAGYGKQLLRDAETVAREMGARKLLVISALGTKEYYKRAGYDYVGPYMGKSLN